MANYITLSEAKTYLGITDTTQDTKLTLIIDWVQDIIVNFIGDISTSDKTENLSLCDIWRCSQVYLKNKPVTAIKKINWVSYTWVLNTDYLIENNKAIINDLYQYLTNLKFNMFSIEYTAGYTTIPDDVKLAMLTLTAQEFNKKDWTVVKGYKLWPRTVDFDNTLWQAEWTLNSIKGILSSYKSFTFNRL